MSDLKISSSYGVIDNQLLGVPQPGMGQVLTDFFNFFLATCRTYNIYDIDLTYFDFEYPREGHEPTKWPYINRSQMEYIFNEILYVDKEVRSVDWIFHHHDYGPMPGVLGYNIILTFQDGYVFDDWMYGIIAIAPSGQFRTNMTFAPYIGYNAHRVRREALKAR